MTAEVRAVINYDGPSALILAVPYCSLRPKFRDMPGSRSARTCSVRREASLSFHRISAHSPLRGSGGPRRQKLRRHLIDQPHAIVGKIETEALPVHAKGVDPENEWLAMSLTDALRRGQVDRQMHLLPRLRLQSLQQDRLHEAVP